MACLSVPASATADPFLITSGVLGFRSEASVIVLNVSGPDFAIPIGDSNPEDFGLPGLAIATSDPFDATFPVSGHVILDLSAPLTLTNVSLPEGCCRRVLLDMTFAGAPVTSYETADGFAGSGPFSVNGELMAFTDDFESPALFRHAIAGSGTATTGWVLRAEGWPPVPRAFATYTFESSVPVPEPGTFVLLATGAVALARRRMRVAPRV